MRSTGSWAGLSLRTSSLAVTSAKVRRSQARRKGRFPAPGMYMRCRRSIVFLLVRVGERLGCSSRVRIRQPTGRPYKHHDLGVAVDLTARNAVATLLGMRLSGRLARLVGRAYHLRALPSRAAASAFRRSQCRYQRRADRRDRPGRVALRKHPRQSQRRACRPGLPNPGNENSPPERRRGHPGCFGAQLESAHQGGSGAAPPVGRAPVACPARARPAVTDRGPRPGKRAAAPVGPRSECTG